MWPTKKSGNKTRMFPYWTPAKCNTFLQKVRDCSSSESMTEMSASLLRKAIELKNQANPSADQIFKISKLISEAAFVTSDSTILDGVEKDEEIDLAMITGMYHIANISQQIASQILFSGNEQDSPMASLGRILIAKEQVAIFTAGIKTNKAENISIDMIMQSSLDSIKFFIATNAPIRRIANNFDHLFDQHYRKRVALPLSLMLAHFLICEQNPCPTELFEYCYSGVPWCVGNVLRGKIDDVVDSLSSINKQIND